MRGEVFYSRWRVLEVLETVCQPPNYAGEAGPNTAGITLARRMYQLINGTGNEQVFSRLPLAIRRILLRYACCAVTGDSYDSFPAMMMY